MFTLKFKSAKKIVVMYEKKRSSSHVKYVSIKLFCHSKFVKGNKPFVKSEEYR
jgi:hypothetical protein